MNKPILQLENVKKEFTKGEQNLAVLRDVSLEIMAGEWVSIMGPSGAGKTTLLNIAGGLMHPTSGCVKIDGDDLFAKSDEALSLSRNQNIGFVFQMHHLLPEFTAEENVMMPARIAGTAVGEALPRARQLLDEVGLEARAKHRPGELSGGEQQRVAIARAMMNQPKLLLADEPTGDLDGPTAREIHHLFKELNRKQGQTVIVVTHNPDLGALTNRTITIEDGRIV